MEPPFKRQRFEEFDGQAWDESELIPPELPPEELPELTYVEQEDVLRKSLRQALIQWQRETKCPVLAITIPSVHAQSRNKLEVLGDGCSAPFFQMSVLNTLNKGLEKAVSEVVDKGYTIPPESLDKMPPQWVAWTSDFAVHGTPESLLKAHLDVLTKMTVAEGRAAVKKAVKEWKPSATFSRKQDQPPWWPTEIVQFGSGNKACPSRFSLKQCRIILQASYEYNFGQSVRSVCPEPRPGKKE